VIPIRAAARTRQARRFRQPLRSTAVGAVARGRAPKSPRVAQPGCRTCRPGGQPYPGAVWKTLSDMRVTAFGLTRGVSVDRLHQNWREGMKPHERPDNEARAAHVYPFTPPGQVKSSPPGAVPSPRRRSITAALAGRSSCGVSSARAKKRRGRPSAIRA
jgi:hypothetical protein